jgi:hypothetical protein
VEDYPVRSRDPRRRFDIMTVIARLLFVRAHVELTRYNAVGVSSGTARLAIWEPTPRHAAIAETATAHNFVLRKPTAS